MEKIKKFDLVVIGAGPGGYVAAIKAAQMGKKVGLIEKNLLGGTCLNVGCIPTKTLLANAEILHKIRQADAFGITIKGLSFDYGAMKERKDLVIEKIRSSLQGLLQSNKIEILQGHAKYVSKEEIKIKGKEPYLCHTKASIIATGSSPMDVPAFLCDHDIICNSTSILEITTLPKHLAIIGGGYIGCEFASLFAELDVKVTIIEALPSIVATQGADIAKTLTAAFEKKGIEIRTNTKVASIQTKNNKATLQFVEGQDLSVDKVLVAVGRKTVVDDLGLERIGLHLEKNNAIAVNSRLETAIPNIYAIGDVTGKNMLAHVASHQGIVAAHNACGGNQRMHYHAIPAVIFTTPEIATVGMTLEEAKKAKYDAVVGKFPFQALGKAQAALDTSGFAQVVVHKDTGQILGAQVVGHDAGNLIAQMALAINNELTLECITETVHAHPTLAESWLEAALIANNTPIHFPPKAKP